MTNDEIKAFYTEMDGIECEMDMIGAQFRANRAYSRELDRRLDEVHRRILAILGRQKESDA